MQIKTAGGRTTDLHTLQTLLSHPDASPRVKATIEQEMRTLRAGQKGERDAAYQIDFDHGASKNWAVIHDLRIEWQGRVAQIDHLLISRFLDIWVCESKSFGDGVAINEHGEFTRFFGGRPVGTPSPLEQNRRHVAVLKALLNSSVIQLPTRLGIALQPVFESVVLVADSARITRPKTSIPGLDRVIHAEKLRSLIERKIDETSPLAAVGSALKLVSSSTLEAFGRQLAAFHRPIVFDWHARFGLSKGSGDAGDQAGTPAKAQPVGPRVVEARSDPSNRASESVARRQASGSNPTAASEPVTPPPAAPAVARPDLHEEHLLSTSKFAAAKGFGSTKSLLAALVDAGYLEPDGDGHRLTDRARGAGARHIEKSRIGPYFVWPADLVVERLAVPSAALSRSA